MGVLAGMSQGPHTHGNSPSKLESPDGGQTEGDCGLRLHPRMTKVAEAVTGPGPLRLPPLSTPPRPWSLSGPDPCLAFPGW